MAEERFERLAQVATFLLHTNRPLRQEEIVAEVPGYPEGPEARRKAFERDKRELRDELGIELVEEGGRYSVNKRDVFLDLDLTDDERAALNVALSAVSLEGGSGDAMRKLGGRTATPLAPLVHADLDTLPDLPLLHRACRDRRVLRFRYRDGAREVEPYGLLFRDGFWYLHGLDRGDGVAKNFRIDRVDGAVAADGPSGAFERPAVDLSTVLPEQAWLLGDAPPLSARVWVDGVFAGRAMAEAGEETVVERRDDGSVVLELVVRNQDALMSWVLGMLDRAELLSPPELRSALRHRLLAVAGDG